MAVPTPWLRRALIATACVVAGCTSASGAPPTSAPLTQSPAAPDGNLPTGCETIELRSPAGETVELTGIWIQDDQDGRQPSRWWIRTFGDCVWGSGMYDTYTEDEFLARSASVQVLQGRMGSDFVIDGTMVLLGPGRPSLTVPHIAEVRIIIDFDDAGQIMLREDRLPGVQGPRCPNPAGYCPLPLLLRPA